VWGLRSVGLRKFETKKNETESLQARREKFGRRREGAQNGEGEASWENTKARREGTSSLNRDEAINIPKERALSKKNE